MSSRILIHLALISQLKNFKCVLLCLDISHELQGTKPKSSCLCIRHWLNHLFSPNSLLKWHTYFTVHNGFSMPVTGTDMSLSWSLCNHLYCLWGQLSWDADYWPKLDILKFLFSSLSIQGIFGPLTPTHCTKGIRFSTLAVQCNTGMQQHTNAATHQCSNAPTQQCTNAPMQECSNATMQECSRELLT